jgi:lipopolysaccharide export system protein LptA
MDGRRSLAGRIQRKDRGLDDAKARRTADGKLTDEITGEHISYVAREERYAVTQLPDSMKKGDRRGTLVLQPARKDPLAVPSSAATTSATASAPVPE